MHESIILSVGLMGKNMLSDITIVQDMLNRVPVNRGGPLALIDDSGSLDDDTINAIKRFQNHQFKTESGIIEPGSKTMQKLNLHARNPLVAVNELGEYLTIFQDNPYKR